MKILGIDHATVHGGLAVLVGDSEFACMDTIDLSEFEGMSPERAMFDVTDTYIEIYHPNCVALEKPMALRNGKIARMLIQVYTGAKLAAELRDVPVVEVTPQEVKLYTAGHGQAEKEDVARALVAQFGIPMDKVAPPIYYKTGKKKGQLRDRLWDVSDSMALAIAASRILHKRSLEAIPLGSMHFEVGGVNGHVSRT